MYRHDFDFYLHLGNFPISQLFGDGILRHFFWCLWRRLLWAIPKFEAQKPKMATIQGPKGLVRRNSVRKFGQVMQVMKISPFFGVRKNAGWDLLPTSNQSFWGKRSVWSDSWGPPELFVEVEGTEVIFHFDPKLNGRFHHLISSWRDASKLSQEIWPQEFFKKPPSCELQVTWILEDKTLLSMEWSLIQHSLERQVPSGHSR